MHELTPQQKGTGSVRDICTSCGYPFKDAPGNQCEHHNWHDKAFDPFDPFN